MSSMKKIVLTSFYDVSFEIDEAVALMSETIAKELKKNQVNIRVPFTTEMLGKVIEYCEKHVVVDGDSSSSIKEEELKNWDAEFTNSDLVTLLELVHIARYLKIESLCDVLCRRVDDMVKYKTPHEIRDILNTKDDTPEENKQIDEENSWAWFLSPNEFLSF